MGCGMGMIKYLLFIFNFIFVLCGLAILIVGILVQLGDKTYTDQIKNFTGDLVFPSITLIVIGSIIFVIAFCGCCGAIRESHCMVITFASLLLTILIIQVAVAIYTFVVLNNAEEINFRENYDKIFHNYKQNNESKDFIDLMQKELECCGVDDYKDFRKIKAPIPGSCCGKDPANECSQYDAYKTGCLDSLKHFFKSTCAVLGGIALGIAAIELIGIIFALCLANSIKNAERRGYSV